MPRGTGANRILVSVQKGINQEDGSFDFNPWRGREGDSCVHFLLTAYDSSGKNAQLLNSDNDV